MQAGDAFPLSNTDAKRWIMFGEGKREHGIDQASAQVTEPQGPQPYQGERVPQVTQEVLEHYSDAGNRMAICSSSGRSPRSYGAPLSKGWATSSISTAKVCPLCTPASSSTAPRQDACPQPSPTSSSCPEDPKSAVSSLPARATS